MTRALLVIDVQESFRQRPSWEEVSNPDIVDDVGGLVKQARETGTQVIWMLHSEPDDDDVFNPANGHVRLMDGLVAEPDEPVLTKTSANCFTTTNLGQILTTNAITELVITGIQTEQCCETTARLAGDLGYAVTFVTDATATFPIVRPDTGDVLGTDEVIARTEFALAGRFATIASRDEVFGS
jgi:nicotinamidase-related amidase